MRKLPVSITILLFFAAVFSYSLNPADIPISLPSARTAAFGGIHTALADDISTLFSNPAGFNSVESQFSVGEITTRLSGPVFTITNVVMEAAKGDLSETLQNPDVTNLLKTLYAGANIAGPIYFGYVGSGLGFGIFNLSTITIENAGTSSLAASVNETILFSGGYSFRIPLGKSTRSTLDTGVLLKTFINGSVSLEKSILEFESLFSSISPDLILDEKLFLTTGIGLDIGVRYSYNDTIAFGLIGRNLFAPTITYEYASVNGFMDKESPTGDPSQGRLPIDLTTGFIYTPGFELFNGLLSDFKFALDYRDILDFVTHPGTTLNPLLKIGMGLEMQLLDIIALRGGFSEGLFSSGLGIDLSIFTINLAMFGSELSSEPGIHPVYNIILGLEFRI
jgi:hypothetical protein